MDTPELSLNEWVVLALLAEQPLHGFGIARELTEGTDLGRILTVHRPLVYRALDRLADGGLVEQMRTEPGNGAPRRTVYRISASGRRALRVWFVLPVAHVRDLRIEFLVKLRLRQRSGHDWAPLVDAQQQALASAIDTLTSNDSEDDVSSDVVDLWRHHTSSAADRFLAQLAQLAARNDC